MPLAAGESFWDGARVEELGVREARVLKRSPGRRQEGLGRFGSSGAGLAGVVLGVGFGPAASSAAVIGTWDQ